MALTEEIFLHICEEEEIIVLFMLVLLLRFKLNGHNINGTRKRLCVSSLNGKAYMRELLDGPSIIMHQLFRMDKYVFTELCSYLREKGFLTDNKHVNIFNDSWSR